MSNAELSILMLAYNSQDYIKDAIKSLLNQSFSNFELIVIDDHSTDNTAEIINSFNDKRICYVLNNENKGIVYSRNLALNMAKGTFVAFFDSDDLAHPKKFQKQIEFLKKNPKYGFVGTSVILIDKNDLEIDRWKINAPYKKILPRMIFHNYFVNSSVVFYKDIVKDFSYPENHDIVEDYALWWWLITKTPAINIPEYLTCYRIHKNSIIHQNIEKKNNYESKIYKIILRNIGIEPSEENLTIHISLKDKSLITSLSQQRKNRDWLLRITKHAQKTPNFYALATISFVLNRWFKVCYKSRSNPFLFLNGIFQIRFFISLFIYFIQWNKKN